ncbi:MAG: hypothetical protein EA409_06760 [Saprospirales bacterium]|nr:MAG: hypothetical protein EA409_06760 [Saprospirales bacterium]
MKNTSKFFIAVLLFISTPVFSQLEKGSWLIDARGSTGYDSDIDYIIPRLYTKIGYFPTDFLAVGIRVGGYGNLISNNNYGEVLYAGFARYYINPKSTNYFFYGELEGGIIANYLERRDTETRNFLKPTVGVTFVNQDYVAIEAALGMAFIENPNTGDLKYNNFLLQLGWKSLISQSSKEGMKDIERFFGRGTLSLASGFNLMSDFIVELAALAPVSDIAYNSESIGFNNLSDGRSSILGMQASVGFFLTNQFMFDLGLGFTNYSASDFQGAQTLFSISPGIRYYLPLGQGRNQLFAKAGYEFGGLNQEGLGTDYTYGFLNGGIGINIMLTPGTALELGVDYGNLSAEDAGFEVDTNILRFNYGLRVFL